MSNWTAMPIVSRISHRLYSTRDNDTLHYPFTLPNGLLCPPQRTGNTLRASRKRDHKGCQSTYNFLGPKAVGHLRTCECMDVCLVPSHLKKKKKTKKYKRKKGPGHSDAQTNKQTLRYSRMADEEIFAPPAVTLGGFITK